MNVLRASMRRTLNVTNVIQAAMGAQDLLTPIAWLVVQDRSSITQLATQPVQMGFTVMRVCLNACHATNSVLSVLDQK